MGLDNLTFRCLHHATHATHTAHAAHTGHTTSGIVLGEIVDNGLGGGEEAGNGGSVEESSLGNKNRVDDTSVNHVSEDVVLGIVTNANVVLLEELANNDGTLDTGVIADGTGRDDDGLLNNADTDLLVNVGGLLNELLEALGGVEKSRATTSNNAGGGGSLGGGESINGAVLLLTDLSLAGTTNLDHGNTTGDLGEALLELLLLVLGGGVGNGGLEKLDALLNIGLVACTVENDGLVLGNGHLLGLTKHVELSVLELETNILGDDLATSEDGKILEVGLAVLTKAGGLDGTDLEATTKLVDNEGGKSLTLDVLSDDEEGAAILNGLLKDGDKGLKVGDLAFVKENAGVVELALLGLGVGKEVRGDVAAVELHTLDNLKLVLHGLTVLAGDDTLLANALHGGGNELADVGIAVGGDGGDLLNLLLGGDGLAHALELENDVVDSGLDTAAEVHRVVSGSDSLAALLEDGAGKDGGGGGTITGNVVGLGGNL